MYSRSILSVSVLATVVSAGPIVRRAPHDSVSLGDSGFGGDSGFFDSGSVTPLYAVGSDAFDTSSLSLQDFSSTLSFDHFGGISSFNGFDNFYGVNNFIGSQNVQTFVESSETITCQTADITYIQQQLAILAEYAKSVVLTSICEVEVQTVVWQQWVGTLQLFSEDIRHVSSRSVTFDSHIASFISDVCGSDGLPNIHDFGFTGDQIGASCETVTGFNWNSDSSPSLVESAFQTCNEAAGFPISLPDMSSIEQSCGSYCSYIPSSLSSSYSGGSGYDYSSSGDYSPPYSGYDYSTSVDYVPPYSGYDYSSSVDYVPPYSGYDYSSSVDYVPPYSDGSYNSYTDGSYNSYTDGSYDTATDSSGDYGFSTLSDGSSDPLPTDVSPSDISATDASLTPIAAPTAVGASASVANLTPVAAPSS